MMALIAIVFMVLISAVPTFAATSSNQSVTVTVNPTIAISAAWNSGANNSTIALGALDADNMQKTFTGEVVTDASNIPIDVYVRALAANFQGPDTLGLNNFMYSGGSVSSATAFTTSYAKYYDNWAKPNAGLPSTSAVTLYMTIPYGTGAGNYNNTVFFSAVTHGPTAPTTP